MGDKDDNGDDGPDVVPEARCKGLLFFLMIHVTKAVMRRMKRTVASIIMMLILVLS